MICAWQEFLSILPPWLRCQIDEYAQKCLQEIRLRVGQAPELVEEKGGRILNGSVNQSDLSFCVNTASHYSPWAAQTISQGYITAPGGHRIGICGEAAMENGNISGMRSLRSVCIRVARDFPGIGEKAAALPGSILLIGPPGSGKTTLLRDIVRYKSRREPIGVVDERRELFPINLQILSQQTDAHLDVLSGCPKPIGVEMLIRTMSPSTVAVDEITAASDCEALTQAAWCGVHLLATAHAAQVSDLRCRPLYRRILEDGIFDWIVVMRRDKSWVVERN